MRISKAKQDKISEQILALLFTSNLRPLFTSQISHEIARDEEFVKKILFNLKKKGLVNEVTKNPKGVSYLKRSRWQLSDLTYSAYKQRQ
ncbi:MAG: hypothetical protein Q7S56_03890 [Nanoarchaeota archaeon]|nr:hypothetical protein [Nanoarchaeota archaeon]